MTSLKDKVVLITGASAGIGSAIARQFSKEGARLIIMARRKDKLLSLASELKSDILPIQIDIRNNSEVIKAVDNLPEDWKKIDILVNNAGLSRGLEKLHEGKPDDWDEMIDTNIKGLLYVSRAVIPLMSERNSGHIINIGSIAGHEMYPAGNIYAATKYAVRAITKGMLMDLVDRPIRVTSIDPGLVETEFSQVRFRGDKERAKTVYQGYTPLKGEDVAEAVIFAATRPAHVQIAEMIILPTDQAGSMLTHKTG